MSSTSMAFLLLGLYPRLDLWMQVSEATQMAATLVYYLQHGNNLKWVIFIKIDILVFLYWIKNYI